MIELADTVLLLHAAATWFMVGLIWFVQVVHYPLLSETGNAAFTQYERRHVELTGWVVVPPMLLELAATILICWLLPNEVRPLLAWLGAILLLLIWGSTALLQVPCHRRLSEAFDASVHRRLVRTNWVRTISWTARGVIALQMLSP